LVAELIGRNAQIRKPGRGSAMADETFILEEVQVDYEEATI
jgi:hypothetical protein